MNNGPNFLVNLTANVKDFADKIKGALSNATSQITQFAQNTKTQLGGAFSGMAATTQLNAALQQNIKQYNELKNSVLGFSVASQIATTSWQEQLRVASTFNGVSKLNTKSAQQLGMTMISSGKASVDAIQQILAQNGFATLSVKQLQVAISQLAISSKADLSEVAKAMGMVGGSAGAAAGGNKGGGAGGGIFAGFGPQVIAATLISRTAWQVVRSLTEAIQEATKATVDFAQAQYTLGVQSLAAQKVFGSSAPTLAQYRGIVNDLRQSTKIYSETDITKAVSQVAVLTRALGLNADQQKQIIEIGQALAQTTGVDLSQAVQDTVRALGGSSVVLDKYGLFIRDADKNTVAMSMGLGQNAKSLNSQELALVSLNTILKQTGPLYASLGDYAHTLPGRLKEVDASISDNTKKLGGISNELEITFKNLYNDFLGFLAQVNQAFGNNLEEMLKKANDAKQRTRELTGSGITSPDLSEYNVKIRGSDKIKTMLLNQARTKGEQLGLGTSPFFSKEMLSGTEEDIQRFLDAQNRMLARAQEQEREQARKRRLGEIGENSGPLVGTAGFKEEADAAAVKKYGQEIIDAYEEHNKALKEREDKRNADLAAAGDELNKTLQESAQKAKEKADDLSLEISRKEEDALTKRNRDVEKLEQDGDTSILDAKKKTQDKIASATDEFYTKLKELDNAYYFDSHDAAANNDAVALKQLERKYNLDRSKLQDNLDKKIKDANQGETDEIQQIKDKTAQRKAELETRYKQELEDINTFNIRKQQDLAVDLKRERDAIFQHYYDVGQKIQAEYELQGTVIDQQMSDRYQMIARHLADEEQLTGTTLQAIFDKYKDFLGPGGGIETIIKDFIARREQLGGEAGINIGMGGGGSIPENSFGVTGNIGGRQYTITVGSDGTMTSQQIDTILGQIADVFKDIIVKNGGTGRGTNVIH